MSRFLWFFLKFILNIEKGMTYRAYVASALSTCLIVRCNLVFKTIVLSNLRALYGKKPKYQIFLFFFLYIYIGRMGFCESTCKRKMWSAVAQKTTAYQ